MALEQPTVDKIATWINSKWKTKNCILCGDNNWAINGYLTLSLSDTFSGVVFGGPILPSAAVVCRTCGNTHVINLAVAGIAAGGQ